MMGAVSCGPEHNGGLEGRSEPDVGGLDVEGGDLDVVEADSPASDSRPSCVDEKYGH